MRTLNRHLLYFLLGAGTIVPGARSQDNGAGGVSPAIQVKPSNGDPAIITSIQPNRTLLGVSSSVRNIQQALGMKMRLYRHPREARYFFSPDAEPTEKTEHRTCARRRRRARASTHRRASLVGGESHSRRSTCRHQHGRLCRSTLRIRKIGRRDTNDGVGQCRRFYVTGSV